MKHIDNDGCCGYPTISEQETTRRQNITAAQVAVTIKELAELARDVPTLLHNVSVQSVASAIAEAANKIQPNNYGWSISYYGELFAVTGYDHYGQPLGATE